MKKASSVGSIIVLFIILICVYIFYVGRDLNGFLMYEIKPRTSTFYRDNDIKYSDYRSYAITSKKSNTATIAKTIKVIPNTPYRVSAMVRTEDIIANGRSSASGAGICIINSSETSRMLQGTNEWTKVELMFNSKNREEVEIGFRLGGYVDECTGKAWFSDFKLEQGITSYDSNWNIGCFIFTDTDLSSDEVNLSSGFKVTMDSQDITTLTNNISQFERSFRELSGGKIKLTCETVIVSDPLKSISYDAENGHFVNFLDVQDILDKYIENKIYDHIYVIVRLGDKVSSRAISGLDWIGLGGMDYYGIGFSNIRLPNDPNNIIYKYDAKYNTFPEEVLVHEFLHTFERNMIEYGYDVPVLHNYGDYGYQESNVNGLRSWYKDYMQCKILDKTTNQYVGLKEEIYTRKPTNANDFEFAIEKPISKEPKNPIERLTTLIKTLALYKEKSGE